MLDPFCGTGTTVVECKKLGIPSVGYEANPMAALACRVKSDWAISSDELIREANLIASSLEGVIADSIRFADSIEPMYVREQTSLFGLRTLEEPTRKLLLDNSISPKPLHRSLLLAERINSSNARIRDHLRLALAWTLVCHAGNIRFGPEVGITPPKEDCDVVRIWLDQSIRMAKDIREFEARKHVQTQVFQGDSRRLEAIEDRSVSAVFTSPPYPNEKDYTRTTRLESVLLGLLKNREDLRRLKDGLLRSNTRNVYVNDIDDQYVANVPEIQRLAEEIEARRLEMGKNSGFEKLYHRVTKLYFGGMARHLIELKPKLRPGAMLGYVVGDQASYLRVHIRTGDLLAQLATMHGYELVSIDLFRTRQATATKQQLREEVVVLRFPG